MTLFSDAQAVYVGDVPVDRAYCGDLPVWPADDEPTGYGLGGYGTSPYGGVTS